MRRFFISPNQVAFPISNLSGEELVHLRKVLRLQPDDTIGLFDGTGYEYTGRIREISSEKATVEIMEKTLAKTESPIRISLGQAFLKEKKMEGLLRQVTEMGIFRWIPFFCRRSIPSPSPSRISTRKERWRKIMIEALKQSAKSRMVDIRDPLTFQEMLELSNGADLKIIFREGSRRPVPGNIDLQSDKLPQDIFIVLGPEGGFCQNEVGQAVTAGFQLAGLGPRILRAQTATVAACALIQYLYGDLGKKN